MHSKEFIFRKVAGSELYSDKEKIHTDMSLVLGKLLGEDGTVIQKSHSKGLLFSCSIKKIIRKHPLKKFI